MFYEVLKMVEFHFLWTNLFSALLFSALLFFSVHLLMNKSWFDFFNAIKSPTIKIGLQISIEKLDNLKEMDEFTDLVLTIKWNKNELSNLNKLIKISEKEKQI